MKTQNRNIKSRRAAAVALIVCLVAAWGAPVRADYVVADSETTSPEASHPEQRSLSKLIESTKVIVPYGGTVLNPDSVQSTIALFYINQFRHFQDPKAPYFMLMSKDSRLAMGVGGKVKFNGWYGWNGALSSSDFNPSGITIPHDPSAMRELGASASGTAVFFTLLGRSNRFGNYMAYVEGKFSGYNHVDFTLKKAYITLGNWTGGLATSTFCDPASQTPTVDGSGPNGRMDRSNILVRYMHTFGKNRHWTVAGSFEFPSSDVTDDGVHTKKSPDYIPDLAALGQYQWDGGLSHVRISGLLRFIPYRDLVVGKNHTKAGWGLQLSTVVKAASPLTFYGHATIGEGHASYIGDLGDAGIDLIPDPSQPGKLRAPTIFSYSVGAKYNFTDNLYSCLAFSQLSNHPGSGAAPDMYKSGLYGAVNFFWDISPRFTVGAEYLIGRRENISGSHACADRVDAMLEFSF